MTLYGLVWPGMAWYGLLWPGMAQYGLVLTSMAQNIPVGYYVVLYGSACFLNSSLWSLNIPLGSSMDLYGPVCRQIVQYGSMEPQM